MMTVDEALQHTGTIVEALQRLLEQAMAHARTVTQAGRGIDEHQVHCERLAYRATELRAMHDLLRYATDVQQHDPQESLMAFMALAFAAEVGQKCRSDMETQADDYGFSDAVLQDTLATPEIRRALHAGGNEAVLRHIGQAVLETNGVNNCWLGDDLAALTRQSVRDFTRQEVEPLAERIHRHNELAPDDLIAKMGALGFFAMSIPETYGGTGMGYMGMILTTEELSRGSLGAAGSLITRPEIVARALLEGGTEAQRRRWLPRIASGELMVAVSVTEPDVGSDVASITCRATPGTLAGQQGYFIDGAKAWCTFAGRGDLIGLLARTDPDVSRGARGVSLFLIEKERCYGHDFVLRQPHGGLVRGKADATLGYRGMHSFTMHYDNYFIPADHLVGEAQGLHRGFSLQMSGFANGRLQTGGRALGLSQAAFEHSVAYTKQRTQFGRAISTYQLTQYKLGRMVTHLAAARQLTYAAARSMERDPGMGLEAAMAKLFASDVAVWLTQEGQLLHGGWGYAEETAISRYVVDALVLPIFEGVKPILELKVIARQLLR
jgi:(2S)-methylsuccinyl-CoA dehydrogenase